MDQNLSQNVETLFANLEDFTQNEGLIGKPVVSGDKTFIPVVSLTMGYGSGNSATKAQQGGGQGNQSSSAGASGTVGNMAGGALGIGAKLCTDAVIVIDKDNVSLMQLNAATSASQLVEKIPQIISGMTQGKQSGQNQDAQSGGQTGSNTSSSWNQNQ
jgi:uncharacterized spore protein YtfJ